MYQLTREKFLSESEVGSLTAKLSAVRSERPRDVLLIEVTLATGARASEVLNIRATDIYLDADGIPTIFIRGLKGSNDREVPVSREIYERLLLISAGVQRGSRVFQLTYGGFRYIWESLRTCEKGLHSMRHYRALEIYRKTKDILAVKYVLGHRSIGNTMIYLNFVQSLEQKLAIANSCS